MFLFLKKSSGSNDHTTKFWTRSRPGDMLHDNKLVVESLETREDGNFNSTTFEQKLLIKLP